MQEIKMKSCSECGSKNISWNNAGLICNECGAVLEEPFFSGERIVA
jgi:transcription initiation factor TFIIIB Brf1 subunit/transcription initiation factor TFIIB